MKLLLTLIAVFVLLWLLRSSLRRMRAPTRTPRDTAAPQAMLACTQCRVHLPANEALPGRGGVFCGPAHRAAFEEAHPE